MDMDIEIRIKKGNEILTLHPTTSASQVDYDGKQTIAQVIASMLQDIEAIKANTNITLVDRVTTLESKVTGITDGSEENLMVPASKVSYKDTTVAVQLDANNTQVSNIEGQLNKATTDTTGGKIVNALNTIKTSLD